MIFKKNKIIKFFVVLAVLFFGAKFGFTAWTEQTGSGSRDWWDIDSSSDGTKLSAIVAGGYVYTSSDGGVTWDERTDSGIASWVSIASSDDGVKLVASAEGTSLYTSIDGGVNWTEQSSFFEGILGGPLTSSSDGTKLAIGLENYYVFTSTDSGANWVERNTSGDRDWRGITSSDNGTKLAAAAYGGYIYTSTDSGVSWTEQAGSGSRNWKGIASSDDGTKLAAVVEGGYIYTSTDSGVSWTEQAGSGSRNWHSVASSSNGARLVAGVSGGSTYTSNDSGITWVEYTGLGTGSLRSVASSSDGVKLATSSRFSYIYTFELDTVNPSVLSLDPIDNATDITITNNLVIVFDEAVDVETGNITIYKSSDDSVVESVDITSGQVTGTGTDTLTINPTSDFANGAEYYIQIDATAVDDTTGNSFPGISDETTWNFTTVSAPSSGGGGGGSPSYACDDELDNDSDGLVDYSEDPGCEDRRDRNEFNIVIPPPITYICSDGIDNDSDGSADYPADAGCVNASDQDESNQIISPPVDEEPTDPCILNPSSCVPPPIDTDPCITNPSSCNPPPPTDPCLTNGTNCPPLEEDPIDEPIDEEIDPPIEDCGSDCTVIPDDPIDSGGDDPDFCPPGILNSAECIVLDSFEYVDEIYLDVTSEIKEIALSDYGNVLIKTISITGLIFGAIFTVLPTLFANPLSFSEIALIPVRLWSMLMTLFGIKKKSRKWGVVYDSVTKQPLDPVYVALQDIEGKEIMSSLTDIDGRYGFLVEPGKYRLLPKKTNYSFPSLKVVGKTRDEIYLDLYFGYVFEITHSGEVISKNIPMDPVGFDWNEFAKKEKELTKFYSKRDILFSKIADVTFSIGITLAFIALVTAPVNYNIAIFVLYLIVLVVREFGIRQKKSSRVLRKGTDIPLAYAIVRVFDIGTNIEIMHKVTNQIGKFFALVRNGKYYVTIEAKNEDGTYTKVHTSEPIEVKDGIIDKSFEV